MYAIYSYHICHPRWHTSVLPSYFIPVILPSSQFDPGFYRFLVFILCSYSWVCHCTCKCSSTCFPAPCTGFIYILEDMKVPFFHFNCAAYWLSSITYITLIWHCMCTSSAKKNLKWVNHLTSLFPCNHTGLCLQMKYGSNLIVKGRIMHTNTFNLYRQLQWNCCSTFITMAPSQSIACDCCTVCSATADGAKLPLVRAHLCFLSQWAKVQPNLVEGDALF